MAKIIGNTTTTTSPQTDWNQKDSAKADYLKNKPTTLDGYGITDAAKAADLTSHTGNKSNPHAVTKAQVGLGNVANERQYSAQNPPPYPVTSVAGKTGAVTLAKSDVGLGNVENKSSATIRGEITSANVTTALGYTPLNATLKGSNNGVAELDSTGKVPSSQLPSYVDDCIEGYLYNSKFYKESAHTTEISGESGKIYIDLSTNKTYRWSGSAFIEISASLALGETSSTAYRGDRGKIAYDHSQATHARTDATKVESSTTNGNIKINGTETNVYTHPTSGITAGTYKSVTVDANGHITGGTNPTTLSGYGITDAETKGAASSALSSAKEYTDSVALGKANADHVHSVASTSAAGFMSAEDKAKLDGIATGANTYTLPVAGTSLGGIKSGTDITVDANGNVSVKDDSHNHVISNVDGLQTALDGKASIDHTHDYGTLSVSKGGTGNTTLASGSYLVGNGTGAITTKTAAQLYEDIKSLVQAEINSAISAALEGSY